MIKNIFVVVLIILSILLASASSISPVLTQAQQQQTITLGALGATGHKTVGTVQGNARNGSEIRYQPLVTYLASKIGNGTVGRVIIANTTSDLIKLLRNQKIDIYINSSLISALVDNNSGAVPFLRGWVGGLPSIHSVLVAKIDSPTIYQLFDLYGKTIGFSSPYSTAGYLLPKSYLIEKGFRFSPPSPTEDLFYTFTGSQNNTLTQILNQKVDVGAISSIFFEQLPATIKSQLKVVNVTADVPANIVSHRSGLPQSLVGQLRTILLNMSADPIGISILKNLGNETQFDTIPSTSVTINNLTKLATRAVNGTGY